MPQHKSYRGIGPKGYQRSDESILEDACERLTRHGMIDASDIEVSVERGELTLNGTVKSRPVKRMAESILDDIPGVFDIHNRLQVRTEYSPPGVQNPGSSGQPNKEESIPSSSMGDRLGQKGNKGPASRDQ